MKELLCPEQRQHLVTRLPAYHLPPRDLCQEERRIARRRLAPAQHPLLGSALADAELVEAQLPDGGVNRPSA